MSLHQSNQVPFGSHNRIKTKLELKNKIESEKNAQKLHLLYLIY